MTVYPCPSPLEATLAPLIGAAGFMLMAALLIWFTLWARNQFYITEYVEEDDEYVPILDKLEKARKKIDHDQS